MGTKKQTYHTFSDSDSAVNNFLNGKKREVEASKKAGSVSADMELIMKRKRSVILTIATNTGIKEPNSWSKFNLWMKNNSIFKKELHAYDFDELDQLTRQFRGIEKNYNESAKKVGNVAWHHATGIPKISDN